MKSFSTWRRIRRRSRSSTARSARRATWDFNTATAWTIPRRWSLWEAQFGDFVNAAQVVIDQFLVSAEDKVAAAERPGAALAAWVRRERARAFQRQAGAVSALAAEAQHPDRRPSTPAQYFHLLRRQVKRRWRKPLVVMTPKSLLRHPQAVSPLQDFAPWVGFQRVLAGGRPDKTRTRPARAAVQR